jgi:hypothetical protein
MPPTFPQPLLNTDRYLWLTVFMTGLGTMALEFAASRLLGNVFGTSNMVWAVVIGLLAFSRQ